MRIPYTAVIATTPREPWVEQALDSIVDQSAPPTEVMVVINGPGSTGSSLGARLGSRPKITVIETQEASQSGAFGLALACVRTPYVAFLDADDLWLPGKQERQLSLLECRPSADAAVGVVVSIDDRSGAPAVIGTPRSARLFSATTFRTSVFDRVGPPDPAAPHFGWMYRWWLTAMRADIEITLDDVPALSRRIHTANRWITDNERGRRDLLSELRRSLHDAGDSA